MRNSFNQSKKAFESIKEQSDSEGNKKTPTLRCAMEASAASTSRMSAMSADKRPKASWWPRSSASSSRQPASTVRSEFLTASAPWYFSRTSSSAMAVRSSKRSVLGNRQTKRYYDLGSLTEHNNEKSKEKKTYLTSLIIINKW